MRRRQGSALRHRAAFALVALTTATTFVGCASDDGAKKSEAPEVEPAPAAAPAEPQADGGAVVDELAERWWGMLMERFPTWATSVGDHRFDDRWTETGPEANKRWLQKLEAFRLAIEEGVEDVDRAALPADKALSLELLEREVDKAIAQQRHAFATFDVDQMGGPQATLPYFVSVEHPMKTKEDVENLIVRYRAFPEHLGGLQKNLEEGLAAGRAAPRVLVDRVIAQLKSLRKQSKSKAGTAFVRAAERIPESIPEEERAVLRADLVAAAKESVQPAFDAYLVFLEKSYAPKARKEVGLGAMKGGPEAYAWLASRYTTTKLTPEQIHEIGKKELANIEAEMAKLAKERGHKGDVKSFLVALRKDKKQYAKSRDELLETFRAALKRADEKLPEAFGRLPKLGYETKPMDADREKDAPAAYYQPGSVEDGRDGVFVANLHRFEERPVFNSEVLAFHEAVPGHHLQIAISQELEGLPRFRTEGGFTAFVEGWALYSEQLSDELGLYTSLESRVGYLGYAAWRASRLVVDTGLHHMGWTRQQAIDFLGSHTTLGPIDVENEIDRYITMPGQALAYMVGKLHILSLREHAQNSLGDKYDVRAFHDALLSAGALPLDLVDQHVARSLAISPPTR
jgi:prolyl oligopeptidase